STFRAITTPSQKRQQNFDVPGVVQKMSVKEGDKVKAGDLLAQQNIEADQAHLTSLEMQAKSAELEIQAAAAQGQKDEVDMKRTKTLYENHSGAIGDYEEAQL